MPHAPIALMTDFGTDDTYVGVMKGVITGIAPGSTIIDVTHAIPPGNIRQAAFRLWQSVRYFPKGTVFILVIDPGVGTARRPVALRWNDRLLVGPDNGLFTYLLLSQPAATPVLLENPEYQLARVSTTFHGRDIFAPAGAYLAAGVPLEELGPPAPELQRFDPPQLRLLPDRLEGEILHADHFGNLITSLGFLVADSEKIHITPWLPGPAPADYAATNVSIELPGGERLALSATFGDVSPGNLVAYIGSEALLEIGVNLGSAEGALGLSPGDPITLSFRS
jgi:S-adenosylmethionine hydrolase